MILLTKPTTGDADVNTAVKTAVVVGTELTVGATSGKADDGVISKGTSTNKVWTEAITKLTVDAPAKATAAYNDADYTLARVLQVTIVDDTKLKVGIEDVKDGDWVIIGETLVPTAAYTNGTVVNYATKDAKVGDAATLTLAAGTQIFGTATPILLKESTTANLTVVSYKNLLDKDVELAKNKAAGATAGDNDQTLLVKSSTVIVVESATKHFDIAATTAGGALPTDLVTDRAAAQFTLGQVGLTITTDES